MRALLLAILFALSIGPVQAAKPEPIIAAVLYQHCGDDLAVLFIKSDGSYALVKASEAKKYPALAKAVVKLVHSLPDNFIHIMNDVTGCTDI